MGSSDQFHLVVVVKAHQITNYLIQNLLKNFEPFFQASLTIIFILNLHSVFLFQGVPPTLKRGLIAWHGLHQGAVKSKINDQDSSGIDERGWHEELWQKYMTWYSIP